MFRSNNYRQFWKFKKQAESVVSTGHSVNMGRLPVSSSSDVTETGSRRHYGPAFLIYKYLSIIFFVCTSFPFKNSDSSHYGNEQFISDQYRRNSTRDSYNAGSYKLDQYRWNSIYLIVLKSILYYFLMIQNYFIVIMWTKLLLSYLQN